MRKIYVQNKYKGGNQNKVPEAKTVEKDLELYNQKIRIRKMGENSAPWKKFDPLTTTIFRIYNFRSLGIIKFVALHKY